jgi:hypothetical protein
VCGASKWNSTDFFIRKRSDDNTFTEWKTLAFLDSNIASAQALKHSNGTLAAEVDGSGSILAKKDIIIPNYTAYKTYDTNGGGVNLIYLDGNNRMQFLNGNMTLDAGGKLGIGTNEPAYKLDVRGNLATIGDIRVREGSLYLQNGKCLRFYLNGNSTDMDVFRVSTSNEIEIGGDAPSYGVNTIIKGKKIMLRQNIWDTRLEVDEYGDTHIYKHLVLSSSVNISNQTPCGFLIGGNDYYSYIARTEGGVWKNDVFDFYPNGDNYAFGKFIFESQIVSNQGIKIGDATITWDSANNALKIDTNLYSTKEISAGGVA